MAQIELSSLVGLTQSYIAKNYATALIDKSKTAELKAYIGKYLYVRDGNYTVSVTATHVWTPAGMIEATRSANVIIIDGTIYDDWYQG